jgi:glutamate--cysteine ligase
VSYNSLEGYAASLHQALTVPYAPYQAIGVRAPDGHFRQLTTSLLQIENEFYGTIRPKRVIFQGERPLHALRERGVEYVEVRCMDLDPFEPVGISEQTIRFLDIFLLHCLLADSPPDTPAEIAGLARNQDRVASSGRQPGLKLERGGAEVTLVEWGMQLLTEFEPIAAALDAAQGGSHHQEGMAAARLALAEPARLPSARVLETMAREYDGAYVKFIVAQSGQTRERLLSQPWSEQDAARFREMAEASVKDRKAVEGADSLPFGEYLRQYLSPHRLSPARRVG